MGFEHPFGDFHWASNINPMLATLRKPRSSTDSIPDEITDFAIAWGGPERVANRIQEMIDAGINEVSFYNMAASADPEYGVKWQSQSEVIIRLGGAATQRWRHGHLTPDHFDRRAVSVTGHIARRAGTNGR